MKKFLMVFLFLTVFMQGSEMGPLFESANESMNQEIFQDAANQYESILSQGMESSALYYNLGNAYFRQHLFGHSIWAYEKSLQLDPRNRDALYNLDLAMHVLLIGWITRILVLSCQNTDNSNEV